ERLAGEALSDPGDLGTIPARRLDDQHAIDETDHPLRSAGRQVEVGEALRAAGADGLVAGAGAVAEVMSAAADYTRASAVVKFGVLLTRILCRRKPVKTPKPRTSADLISFSIMQGSPSIDATASLVKGCRH